MQDGLELSVFSWAQVPYENNLNMILDRVRFLSHCRIILCYGDNEESRVRAPVALASSRFAGRKRSRTVEMLKSVGVYDDRWIQRDVRHFARKATSRCECLVKLSFRIKYEWFLIGLCRSMFFKLVKLF